MVIFSNDNDTRGKCSRSPDLIHTAGRGRRHGGDAQGERPPSYLEQDAGLAAETVTWGRSSPTNSTAGRRKPLCLVTTATGEGFLSNARSNRKHRLPPQEARRRRLERYRLRRKRMIHIGLQVDRWHQLKSELSLENDAALAKFLLDYYRFQNFINIPAAASTDSRDLQPWIKNIVRHFISCCLRCGGDANSLMSRWRSILHHTVNVHEWLLGDGCTSAACEHGPLTEKEMADCKWVTVGSPAHCALREVVYDKWLTSHLNYFAHARVTDELEIFNKHIKIYATKNFTYEYKDYYVRTLLAAIDHNSHIDRAFQQSASGEIIYCKMYSKKNRNWKVLPALVKKQYQYFEELRLNILKEKPSKEASQHQSKTTKGGSKKALPGNRIYLLNTNHHDTVCNEAKTLPRFVTPQMLLNLLTYS
ncbi:uncharacterized protein LOC132378131 [Hypanus sabinus]|uniref:uncharacterized protein LOC132378131 n=1 Tax=Hypanus sabinus TaxID=79690 RepID=UPI0028C49C4E|nr:uncharacterized protein LOC132378131 [Hypanus sabinus]